MERIRLDAKYCVCSEWKGSGWTLNIVCVVEWKGSGWTLKYCVCSEWKGSGWTLNIVCVVSGKDLVGR